MLEIKMRKFFLLSIMLIILIIKNAYSEEIKNIEINGNNRISDETILVFSDIKLNSEINSNSDLNKILKDLYNTNYFSDVDIDFNNNKLVINVVENPIIQSVQLNGIKAKKFKEVIIDNLILK